MTTPESAAKVRPTSPARELEIFRYQQFSGTAWVTNEQRPRPVAILGEAALDPDVMVVRIEGDDRARWLMACGNTSFDGNIVGTDIWIRPTLP